MTFIKICKKKNFSKQNLLHQSRNSYLKKKKLIKKPNQRSIGYGYGLLSYRFAADAFMRGNSESTRARLPCKTIM